MPLSSVAEKSMRWPLSGVRSMSRLTGGRNPRSAMWSASSSTVISTLSRSQWRCWMRSSRRPGQATMMSTPLRRAFTWGFWPTPPKMVVVRSPRGLASGAMVASIWMASSRVGARISARGRPGLRSRRLAARRVSTGRAKARVLPEPVRPRPRTSRPSRESGSVAVWMGNGAVMPLRAMASHSSGGTPRAAKVVATSGSAMVVPGVAAAGAPASSGRAAREGRGVRGR